MTTKVYKSYEDFIKRENKEENGVSEDFAANHPDFEEQNKTNTGCWNCYCCDYCNFCESCSYCWDCNWCESCVLCDSCKGGKNL